MSINSILARELNWHKRMLTGAIGTTKLKLSIEARRTLNEQESLFLSELFTDNEALTILLKKQCDLIDAFYLRYGSEATRRTITRRNEVREKLKQGRWDEVTDEEYKLIYPRSK